jgi:hypothetical protein
VASYLRSEFLTCNLGSGIMCDLSFFNISKSCYQMRWSSVQVISGWQLAPVFRYVYKSTMSKSVRNTGLWYLQKLMWLIVKARVALEHTKIFSFFISSNCGFQFYCEPMFCVESVMGYSLLHGMMLGLWHSCLSFSRPLCLLCPTVLVESVLTRTFFVYSVVLCSVFSLHLLILVLFA